MPIVRPYPVGEVSPQPLPNARIDVPAAGGINLFGGNQAQDLQVAGQRLGQASDSLSAIYERKAKAVNDIRVQDANNQYIDGTREILRTGPDAYYKQSGADAINGAGATIEKLTKLKDQIFGQAPNDYQRQRLRSILDSHLAASADAVARHADDQQAAYGRKVASTAIQTSHADAVANPANLPNAMVRAEGAARALYAGQAPEIVEAEERKAGLSVVSALIGDQLGRNDPEGLALFQQYRDQLDPRDRRVLGAAAETLTNTIAAADWLRDRGASLPVAPAPTGDAALDAVNVASASIADPPPVTSWGGRLLQQEGVAGHRLRLAEIEDRRRALTALNEQEFAGDPVRLRANQAAIDTDTAWNRAAAKAEADKAYADLQRHMTTGGPGGGPAVSLPPATLMSRFTDAQQEAVAAQVNRAIEGKKTRTDQPTRYAIHQGLTGDDANERERWADTNLVQFRGQLSDEDFAALTKLQTTVRTNDGSAEATRQQAITRMANRALLAAGIDPAPGPDSDATQAATFHRVLEDELSAFESSKGRPATAAEAQDIVDRLATIALKSDWFKASDQNDALTDDVKLVLQPSHIPEEVTDASLGIQASAASQADTSSQTISDGSGTWDNPNIVPVAGGDKKKDGEPIRLPGSGGRGPYRDNEIPPPKQINPLATPGGGGGGQTMPRPSPKTGGAAAEPAKPGTPSSGGAGKAPAGGGDPSSKQVGIPEAGTNATTTFIYGPDGKRVPVPAGLSDEEFKLFKYGVKRRLEWDSQTGRRILSNLDMQVERFLGTYRKGRITHEFPTEFRQVTLRELYDSPASAAKTKALKLLRDGRFERE